MLGRPRPGGGVGKGDASQTHHGEAERRFRRIQLPDRKAGEDKGTARSERAGFQKSP